jgi:UDP-N-acetylmuramyl pentapeptide phosphotransferase/UDP-N-acetylglucosamine-1-phosphate transferase
VADVRWGLVVPAILAFAAAATIALIVLLMPLLARYALARPNARSSHRAPTPQGGGIAIVVVMALITSLCTYFMSFPIVTITCVLVATVALAVVGAIDDIVTLRAMPRLFCQIAASIAVLAVLPASYRIVDSVPLILERGVLVVGLVWFINLVNFMDGLDWITVAEVIPLCAGLVLFAILGFIPPYAGIIACALGGSTLGFAPFNRPVARLFLGDVGSLPLGLVLGWLLVIVACNGHIAAAILMPLYYVADASITLGLRLSRGERVWEAHRTHYYQQATTNGHTVIGVVGAVFKTNITLLGLAVMSALAHSVIASVLAVVAGAIVVARLLAGMVRPR